MLDKYFFAVFNGHRGVKEKSNYPPKVINLFPV